MEKVSRIASYIIDRYKKQFGEMIDEIKLQKLLYFTQLEAIVRTGEPMFDAEFHAWKFGPVVIEIHERFKTLDFDETLYEESELRWKGCFDYIFEHYAPKKSMSLVWHSHCQRLWKRAREGIDIYERSDVPMRLTDIYEDAEDTKRWRNSLPLRRKVHLFFDQHLEIYRIPVIHSL